MVSTKNVGGHQDGRARDGGDGAVAGDAQRPAVLQRGTQARGSTEVLGTRRILGCGGALLRIQRKPGSQMGTPIPGAQPLDEACPGGSGASGCVGKDGDENREDRQE